jgi:hypothetical protein
MCLSGFKVTLPFTEVALSIRIDSICPIQCGITVLR